MTTTPLPDRPSPTTASYILATFIIAACAGYFLGQASSIGLFSSSSSSSSSRKSKKPTSSSSSTGKSKSSWPNSYDVTVHPDSSDEELMKHLKGGKTKNGGGSAGQKKKKKKQQQEVKDSEDDDDDESESENESDTSDENGTGAGSEEWDPAQSQSSGLKMFEENRGEECKMVLVVRTDLGMGKGKIAAQCAHATLACYKYHLSHSHPSSPSPLLRRWESTGQAKIALQVASLSQLEELRAKAESAGLCAQMIHDAGRTQIASGSATVLGVGPGPRSVVDGVTGGLRLL